LEYWNIGTLEYWEKQECCQFKNIKMNLYFIKVTAFRNPSFHHSIIPLFPLDYLLEAV